MMGAAMEMLSDAELAHLQELLVANLRSAGSRPLDIAQGYLTALAAAPTQPDAKRELDFVLGGLVGDAGLRLLVQRFQASVLRDLRDGDFSPMIPHIARADGSVLPVPYGWCEGYANGLEQLGEDARETLFGDPAAAALLAPILAFLMYPEESLLDPPDLAAHLSTVAELGPAAQGVFAWWLRRSG